MSGSNPISDIISGVGDAVNGVVNAVGDVGHSIDSFVRDTIPGGWVTVGAGALLAAGITDPELLSSAEEGSLTSTKLANAGYDAVNVARDVSTLAPEVVQTSQAALASGVSPATIAMANATADPIAALNAAAGWTVSDPAYLMSIGYAGTVVDPLTGSAVDVDTAARAQTNGWTSATNSGVPNAQYVNADGTYFDAAGNPIQYADTSARVVSQVPTVNAQGVNGVQVTDSAGNSWFQPMPETAPPPTAPAAPTSVATETPITSVAGPGGPASIAPEPIAPTAPTPATTVSVSLPDGSPGMYDPATGTVYNMDGTVNYTVGQAPTAGPGTQVATAETPYRVDVSGAAGTAESPTYAIKEAMTPGSQLATQAEIDAGTATWNPTANAWEVAGNPAPLTPVTPGEIGATGAGGSAYGAGGANYVAPIMADAAEATVTAAGLTATQVAALGGTVAAAAVVNSVGASGAAEAANAAMTPPATTAPAPTTTAPVAPTTTAPPVTTTPAPLSPVEPVVVPPSQPIPEVVATTPTPAPVDNLPPVTDLSTTAQPMGPSPYDWVAPAVIGAGVGAAAAGALKGGGGGNPAYTPLNKSYPVGQVPTLATGGLNPGFVTAQPFYNTTSPVQAQYYWGAHPYVQTAADLANLNNIPYAPAVPWGLQQPQAPFDVNTFIAQNVPGAKT
jgi:hypothetical protein